MKLKKWFAQILTNLWFNLLFSSSFNCKVWKKILIWLTGCYTLYSTNILKKVLIWLEPNYLYNTTSFCSKTIIKASFQQRHEKKPLKSSNFPSAKNPTAKILTLLFQLEKHVNDRIAKEM